MKDYASSVSNLTNLTFMKNIFHYKSFWLDMTTDFRLGSLPSETPKSFFLGIYYFDLL